MHKRDSHPPASFEIHQSPKQISLLKPHSANTTLSRNESNTEKGEKSPSDRLQLLAKDFLVRGIVRSQAKAGQVRKDNPSTGKNLEDGIVPDITTPIAFNEVIKADPPFEVVLHQASSFLFKVTDDNERDFLVPAVKGTEEILKGMKAYAPSVRRVVLTSSCAAVLDWKAGDDGKFYTEEDWNPTTWEEALNGDKGEAYRGSKKCAEKAGKSDCIVKLLLV